MMNGARIVHLTFKKCGSQWVRDVLTAPEIVACTETPLFPHSFDLPRDDWPDQPPGTFMGPVYDAGFEDWERLRRGDDKAIVVLRDPRDRMISLVYSLTFSHVPNPAVSLYRELLLPMSLHRRLLWGMLDLRPTVRLHASWGGGRTSTTYLVSTYEQLIADPHREFSRILGFCGWKVRDEVLAVVIRRLSFAERSGRQAGSEDVFSHYRKGEAGDWRRHFDRSLGQAWERLFPNLLSSLGYERDADWPEALPEEVGLPAPDDEVRRTERVELLAELVRLREQNAELQRGIEAFRAHLAARDEAAESSGAADCSAPESDERG